MKQVLVFAEFGTRNGGENSLLAVLPEMKDLGWQFTIAVPCPSELADALTALGFEVRSISFFDANHVRNSLPQIRSELKQIILAAQPDLIHANGLNMGRMLGPVIEQVGIPAISYLRDIVKLNKQSIADLNHFQKLIAVSDATLDFHMAQGLEPQRLRVVLNGIDLARFCPRSKRFDLHKKIGADHGDLIALSIGQIGIRKGWDLLLNAAELVLAKKTKLHFVIAGQRFSTKDESIQYESALREMADTPVLNGRVHFVGTIKDIAVAMNDADFLIHPARQEPLGRVLIEAAASGLPVIATNVGGTEQIFAAEKSARNAFVSEVETGNDISQIVNAMLIPSDCFESLAKAIERMCDDCSLRSQLGESSRNMAVNRFDYRNAAKNLADVYAEGIADNELNAVIEPGFDD